MHCEAARDRLVDGLIGASPEETAAVRQHLAECANCREESAALSDLWASLGSIDEGRLDATSTRRMRARLDAMLESDDGAHRSAREARRGLGAAAAVALLAIGLAFGRYSVTPASSSPELDAMREELQDLRHMVTLTLMQQQSATDRLKGVSWSGQIDAPRNDIVQALLDALANDPNVNVRLASLDALERFADRDVVRRAAIDAVETQMSPLVQIALIDFIVKTGERGSLDTLKRIANDPQVHEAVRARATWGVRVLG